MKAESRIELMREGPIGPALFKLGIPMVVSMLVSALYNVVDTWFVSGLGTTAVAAVSVAFPLSMVFSGLGLTFGVGAGAYISRLLGAGKRKQAEEVAATGLLTGALCGGAVVALMLAFLNPVLSFMGATESTLLPAREYAAVFLVSALFTTFNVSAGNLAVAQGDSHISLIGMLCGSLLNVALDPIFIYSLDMGVAGAAWATLVAQMVSTGIYLWYLLGGKSFLTLRVRNFRPSVGVYREIVKIGISMLLLQLLTSLSMTLTLQGASRFGDEAVAALGIVLRVVTIGTNVVYGYMKGYQPFAGYNWGAKNAKRLREATATCIRWTTGFCVAWIAFVLVFARPLMSGFSDDPVVIGYAVRALLLNTVMFFTFGFQFSYSTLYLALGKAAPGMLLSVSRQGLFFFPAILILPRLFGLDGVMVAQAVADLCTTLLTAVFAVRINREIRAVAEEQARVSGGEPVRVA